MKKSNLRSFVRFSAMFAILLFTLALPTIAQTTTFAQFIERNGSQDFVFTNNTSSADFNTIVGGSPVFFLFQNLPGLDAALQGPQFAHLAITASTNAPAGVIAGGNLAQPFDQTITIQIIRDTPAPPGSGSGTRSNLLTAIITPGASQSRITGAGNSATLSATTPAASDQGVVFLSDFLSFSATTERNLALSFSSVNPALALGSGSFLQNFSAAGSGTFASNPLPVIPPPSTAAQVSVSGRVVTANGSGVRNAVVILVESDGTLRTARTNTFGNFEIIGIQSGQTVFLSAKAKQYTFADQAISLQDNVSGFTFVADN